MEKGTFCFKQPVVSIPSLLPSDGLATWGDVSPYCLGQAQSPINLDNSEADHSHHQHLMFEEYKLINQENTMLENNGHSVELKVKYIHKAS